MDSIWLYTIISVSIVSIVSLVGIFTLLLNKNFLNILIFCMVSFAVGALLGGAFIHLIPEAAEVIGDFRLSSVFVLVGILLFFIFEKFILWRHCHIPTSDDHPHPIVFMNFVGDGVHNFFDGIAIAASYLVSIPTGIATTIAVILHEIPQEIADFGILVHGGLSYKKALLFNLISALFAVCGSFTVLLMGNSVKSALGFLLPITAGGFIYMATADLIPSLHGQRDYPNAWFQSLFVLFGIVVMFLL